MPYHAPPRVGGVVVFGAALPAALDSLGEFRFAGCDRL